MEQNSLVFLDRTRRGCMVVEDCTELLEEEPTLSLLTYSVRSILRE